MESKVRKKRFWGVLIGVVIGVIVLALAVAGVVLALNGVFGGGQDQQEIKLYWNVDKDDYLANKNTEYQSARGVRRDGYYHVKMAVEGEIVDMLAADIETVTRMDNERIMGLRLNKEGIVTDVVILADMPGVLREQIGYIEKLDGNHAVVNTSGILRGTQMEFDLTDVPVYYGSTESNNPMTGTVYKPQQDDTIRMILNESNALICAYALPYQEPGDLYWNVNRMWDSTLGQSTRQLDFAGFYVFDLAVNGEIVSLKTRDSSIANKIDANAAKCFGLTFDENGYINGYKPATYTTGGATFGSWYHVMGLSGNTVSVKRVAAGKDYGNEIDGVMSPKVKIFDVSGLGDYVGQPTTLRVGDQIHGLTDARGMVAVIYVVSRQDPNMKIAWNLERKWDSQKRVTTRQPDADGWYRIKLAIGGEHITAKTQDASIVQKIDSFICYGVILSGDEIVKVASATAVNGGGTFGSYYDVIKLDGARISVKRTLAGADLGKTADGILADDCQVYNVSATAGMRGEKTTLKVGDRVHCFKNLDGKICYIFVVSRPVDVPIYWNKTQKYNSKEKVTTRQPDGEGYYVFEMVVNGELVNLKTKDKEIATKIDASAARCVGLEVSGDIIKKVYSCSLTKLGAGGTNGSWVKVTKVSGNQITAVKQGSALDGTIYNITLASGGKAYCVNNSYEDHYGEETKVCVGDTIHVLVNANKGATRIFVVGRPFEGEMYWNKTIKYNKETRLTTRTPDEDGYYWFDMSTGGKAVKVKTKDITVASFMDSCVARCMVLKTKGDEVTRAVAAACLPTTTGGTNGSWVAVTDVAADGTITAKGGGKTYTIPLRSDCQIYNETGSYFRNYGEKTAVQLGDLIHVLVDKEKLASYVFVVSRDPMRHVPCEHSDSSIEWTAWDGDPAKLESGGHYTLTRDIYINDPAGIQITGKSVSIDLNGHTIGGVGRAFWIPSGVGGTLNLCDHTGRGKIATKGDTSACTGSKGGGAILLSGSAGTARLYGITITPDGSGESTVPEGGLVTSAGTMYLYQCVLDGGRAKKAGNMMASSAGQIICRECTIKNGTAAEGDGGNIWVSGTGTSKATVTLIDTVVTGGQASGRGGGVYLASETIAVLRVGGSTKIADNSGANLYMYGSGNLTVLGDGLASDARILVTTSGSGVIASADKDYTYAIISEMAEPFVFDASTGEMKLWVHPHTAHCACGGIKPDGHICSGEQWIELNKSNISEHLEEGREQSGGKLTGTKRLKANGCYYLTSDITLSSVLEIGKDQEITLCLNGYTLTGKSSYSFAKVFGGSLNICDCYGGGTIVGRTGSNGVITMYASSTVNLYSGCLVAKSPYNGTWGGILYVGADAKPEYDLMRGSSTFSMYGGTLDATDARIASSTTQVGRGGNVFLLGGSIFNLYGGTVKGGSVVKGTAADAKGCYGGNFQVDSGCTLNMYGGTIMGGSSQMTGGNIQLNGTMNLYGGTVTGGTADEGGNIYVSGTLNLYGGTVTGAVDGGNIYLPAGKSVNVPGTLASGASYGITMAYPGIFAEQQTADQSGCFISDDPARDIRFTGNALSLTGTVSTHPMHCVCGGNLDASVLAMHNANDGACEAVEWMAWTDPDALPTTAGNYYLDTDVTLTEAWYKIGVSINLCLNGHTVKSAANARLFTLKNLTMNICDCSAEQTGKLQSQFDSSAAGAGRLIYLYNNALGAPTILNLYGGTCEFIGTKDETKVGTLICVGNDTKIDCAFNMYGGAITGGFGTAAGGVQAQNIGQFHMYGGTITGCDAANGGAVAVTSNTAQFTMHGGTITGCASDKGSAVCITKGTFTMNGGTITGNDGALGAVAVSGTAQVHLTGKVNITGNTGGNVYIDTGMIDITGIDPTSTVGITMKTPGIFAETSNGALAACFSSDAPGYTVAFNDDTLILEEYHNHFHCVCGGNLDASALASHNANDGACEAVEWTAWTDPAALPTTAGNYYLDTDVTLSAAWRNDGVGFNLCLNGHTVKSAQSARLLILNGAALNICDCSAEQTGKLQSQFDSTAAGAGRLLYLYNNKTSTERTPTVLNLYGGTCEFVGTKNETKAGTLICVGNDTKIDCAFNMYGGAITGGFGTSAGAVITQNIGQFHMFGGTITGSEAAKGAVVRSGATSTQAITLSGKVCITGNGGNGLYLTGGTIDVSNLDAESVIGITMKTPGVFAETTNGALAACFISDDPGYKVVFKDDTLILEQKHFHCVCGGNLDASALASHNANDGACEAVEWTEWSDATTLPKTAGSYYLTCDVNLSAAWYPGETSRGFTLNLCLNGHTISGPANERLLRVRHVTLNICDCSAERTGTLMGRYDTTYKAGYARVVALANDLTGGAPTILNLYGGNIAYSGTKTATETGMLITVGNNTKSQCKLNMYGGKVEGGFGTSGGGVRLNNNGQFHMYGGTITGSEADLGAVITTTNSTQKLSLSGNVQFSNNGGKDLYLNKGTLTVDNLSTESVIAISMQTPGVFAETTNGALASCFVSADSRYSVVFADGKLSLAE